MPETGDVLSDILRLVRLRACVYFVREIAAPWGLAIPEQPYGPLHMVLGGTCLLRYGGSETRLEAGDAVLLPHGAPHAMVDGPGTIARPGTEAMADLMAANDAARNGNAASVPAGTRMLCGHFEWDGALDHPLFRDLPDLIVLRDLFSGADAARMKSVIQLITLETSCPGPGGAALADRMGEVLFVSLVRGWLSAQRPKTGILAAMGDPRLGRALEHIHRYAARPIEVAELADVAGMSRTAFAVGFHAVMGLPPASYVTEWRMLQAHSLLTRTEVSLTEIVDRVGYGSEAAFIRAFKRRFGETPARLRHAVSH